MSARKFDGRREDYRLLTGAGCYAADFNVDGQACGAFVRSPYAHAVLERVDVEQARAMPGVVDVLTGPDLQALGYGKSPSAPGQKHADGRPMIAPDWPPLAVDRVRFAGEPVALIVAESPAAALDAVEAVHVDYRELPGVVQTRYDAQPPIAIWPHAPDNVALDYVAGDAQAVERAFASAAHVVTAEIVNQRLVVNAMEPRAVVARYDAEHDRYELHAGSQGAVALREQVAVVMNLPPERVRVVSRDVGGAFGGKSHVYPEYVPLLEAARRLGRAVKWTATRSESFLSDTHARDTRIRGELALDANGNFLAVRGECEVNSGAYLSSHATLTATTNFWRCLAGVYRTPLLAVRLRCLHTNTVPTAPYRGAGRPEANLLMERLVETAASQLGIDRVELRKRNMVPPSAMPYSTPNGLVYDSGEFAANLDRALVLADYAGFPARREAALQQGKLRGVGVACYLELAGGLPFEFARLDVDTEGRVHLRSGLQSNGQGHETVFTRLVAERLGVDADDVLLGEGDTLAVGEGVGTFGSRSMTIGGAAYVAAAQRLIELVRERAASYLETAVADVEYANGVARVAGTDRALTLADVARRAGGLSVMEQGKAPLTFPNGCHVAEVEIDRDTGVTRVVSFVGVDDVGNCIEATLVDGQLHGGVAQGLGQVLVEQGVYDDASGQLLSGSFMDYAMPRADDLPAYATELNEVPCRTNALGTKGVGEAGTTGALAAGYNAVLDALREAGIERFDMPATPGRVWSALNGAT